jgi:uncharacterized membrane protein YdjX (TVP38/TMEM64 family)
MKASWRPSRPELIATAVVLSAILLGRSTHAQELLSTESWRLLLSKSPVTGILMFIAVGAALQACGVSRLLICAVAGAVFGIALGLAASQTASLLSACGYFWLGRKSLARSPVVRELPQGAIAKLGLPGPQSSILHVALIRQIPIHGIAWSLLMGRRGVSFGIFAAGTFLGILPQGSVAVVAGGSIHLGHGRGAWFLGVGAVIALLLIRWIKKQFILIDAPEMAEGQ